MIQPFSHLLGSRLVTSGELVSVPIHPLQLGGGLIHLAILFLILAVVAGVLGAGGVAGLSWNIAKWLVVIFLILAVISFVL